LKRTLSIATTIITLIIFLLTLYILIAGTLSFRENRMVSVFGYSYAYVASESMIGEREDSLFKYDIILIQKKPYDSLEEGDIIVFFRRINIVHRIIEIDENGHFITQGDNNDEPDQGVVTESEYLGYVERNLGLKPIGRLLDFVNQNAMQQRTLLFGLIGIIFLGILILELVNIFKTIKQNQEEKIKEALALEKQKELELEREKLKEEIRKSLKNKD
jgi:signal peptidase I